MVKRKFRVGQTVVLPSGKKGKVIGSVEYGYYKGKRTPYGWTEYRIRPSGSRKTVYRREELLRKCRAKKRKRRKKRRRKITGRHRISKKALRQYKKMGIHLRSPYYVVLREQTLKRRKRRRRR